MNSLYDFIIIGAGVSGTYIARELSKYELKILIIDKENDVANETTAANSAIIHAGYEPIPGTTMAKFNAPGNQMFDKVCHDLDVPFERCGSIVVSFNDDESKTLGRLYEQGIKNGVPNMKLLNKAQVLELEPNLSSNIQGGLYAPTAGIINPWELAIALTENAIDNGVELKLQTKVTNINKQYDIYTVMTDNGNYNTRFIINCAGVFADEIHNMVANPSYKIRPRKGNYYVLDKSINELVNHVIFQAPNKDGKGVLITPTVDGNYLIGPDSEYIDDKNDLSTAAHNLDFVKRSALKVCPSIPFDKVIRSFAGLRASSNLGDFIIKESNEAKGFIDVGGFESPGLSATPAVTEYVVQLVEQMAGTLPQKDNFNPKRRKVIRFNLLSPDEKSKLIMENPAYANVVCRCETVTEAEIVDSIHRSAGARSFKAIRKRVRPGAGRCQGGFCGPKVVEILARELGIDPIDVPYDSDKAYILTGKTKES